MIIKYLIALIVCLPSVYALILTIKAIRKSKQEQKKEKTRGYYTEDAHEYFIETLCDSCGKNPKAQNSQICQECQDKVYERYKGWF